MPNEVTSEQLLWVSRKCWVVVFVHKENGKFLIAGVFDREPEACRYMRLTDFDVRVIETHMQIGTENAIACEVKG